MAGAEDQQCAPSAYVLELHQQFLLAHSTATDNFSVCELRIVAGQIVVTIITIIPMTTVEEENGIIRTSDLC
jgi:hypothetical protein